MCVCAWSAHQLVSTFLISLSIYCLVSAKLICLTACLHILSSFLFLPSLPDNHRHLIFKHTDLHFCHLSMHSWSYIIRVGSETFPLFHVEKMHIIHIKCFLWIWSSPWNVDQPKVRENPQCLRSYSSSSFSPLFERRSYTGLLIFSTDCGKQKVSPDTI